MKLSARKAFPAQAAQPVAQAPAESSGRGLPCALPLRIGPLVVAIWFGVLTGLMETAFLVGPDVVRGGLTHTSPHLAWMACLANACFFAVPGTVLFLIALRWPTRVAPELGTFVYALLGFVALRFVLDGLYEWARLVLATGLAAGTARLLGADGLGFRRLVRASTPCLVIGIAALGLGTYGWQRLAERRALAELPPAAAGRPNVLLIVLDTVRASSLSVYGYGRRNTPELERWAGQGVCFEHAMSPAPWTLPAHGSMFTGRFPHELSADWEKPLDAQYPTLAEFLSAAGYVTAGFVANTYYCSRETGLGRGFAHYEDFSISAEQILLSASLGRAIANRDRLRPEIVGRKTAARLSADFLRWLSRQRAERPFFVFLNYYDAHDPYLPDEPFATAFGAGRRRHPGHLLNWWYVPREELTPPVIEAERDAYDGAIAYLDHQLGKLLSELEQRGILQNTLVVITSDHGEQFGEHGLCVHGNSLYRPLLHVPLLMLFPGRAPAGGRVAEPVSLCDVPATVLDVLGRGRPHPFPGRSLARHWEEGARRAAEATPVLSELMANPRFPEWYPNAKSPMSSLVAEGKHYIVHHGSGKAELYDFQADPLEKYDLASDPAAGPVIESFRGMLEDAAGQSSSVVIRQSPFVHWPSSQLRVTSDE